MSRLNKLFRKLRGARSADSIRQQIEEELSSHVEMLIEEHLADGMSPEEARTAAQRRFGDYEGIRTEGFRLRRVNERRRRLGDFLEALIQDARYGVRMLAKNPGFTTVAVLSLALGIGATSTIFGVLNAAVLRRLPFREPDRLVFIQEFDPEGGSEGRPRALTFLAWREQNQTFEQMVLGEGTVGNKQVVSATGETEQVWRRNVGADLFRLLGVQPILGRTFAVEDFGESSSSSTVLISFELWQQMFGGDPAALGQELTLGLDGTKTIVGVMPPGFWTSPQSRPIHVWGGSDITQLSLSELQNRSRYSQVVGRLKGGVSVEQAQADLQTISRGLEMDAGTEDAPWRVQVEPLAERLSVRYAGTLYVLSGAVGCVLLIACLNVAMLSLGRAAARRKEIATRLAVGAGRLRVVRQLLTESMLLGVFGGVLGVGLAVAGIKLFIALAAGWYPPTDEIQVDGTVLGFTVGLSLLTGIVSGVAPALRSSAVNLTDSLKAGVRGTAGGAGHRISNVLVVLQAALALVLLVGAGLMLNSFARLVQVDPGFHSDHLLTVRFDLGITEYRGSDVGISRFTPRTALVQQQLLERIETLPEVDSVGLVSALDIQRSVMHLGRPAAARDEPFWAVYAEISPDYFRTLQVLLRKGRVFTARDAVGAPSVAIINETMAREFFPGEDPLGARVQADLRGEFVHEDLIDDQPRTIVGVVGDVRLRLRAEPDPVMYVPYGQHLDVYGGGGSGRVTRLKRLVIRTAADPLSLAGAVATAMTDVDPSLVPWEMQMVWGQNGDGIMTMDAWLADSAAQEEFWMLLLGLFAGLAVALAAIGLYGVISYAVAQRTHELGIRTALGAKRTDVFTLIVRRGLVLALLGVAIGIPAALALTGVIANRLFGVTPTDPATFAAAAVMFVSIALLACSIPARRATHVDPVIALRSE